MDLVRKIRRRLRPLRSQVRRVRARRGDLGALLRTPGLRSEDIRWVARTAQGRGETELAKEALLTLVRLHRATEHEQRLLRAMSDPRPVPPVEWSEAQDQRVSAGNQLLISRDGSDGRLLGRLTDLDGQRADAPAAGVWQQEWSQLPRSLADQLAVCALTRIAYLNEVVLVRSADPSTGPLAAAVAQAVGARSERAGSASPGPIR